MAKMMRARSGISSAAAQAAEFALLKDSQKLDLGVGAQLANLVKEERAVLRLLKVALAGTH